MARILVTDAEERSALAIVRSLGRAQHELFACSARRFSLAGASRYCRAHVQLPSPLFAPEAFVDELRVLLHEWRIDILLPVSEASLRAILPIAESLREVRIPFVSAEQFVAISDKAIVAERARSAGIETPVQLRLDAPGGLELLQERFRFPAVLKSSQSVVRKDGRQLKPPTAYINDWGALQSAIAALPDAAYPLLLQQRIEGPGIGVFLLMWEDEVIASFFHRRLREKPPAGGVSVYRESAPPNADLLERSCALLRQFAWQGVAMVEYKLDAKSGIPYLLEVNGRFWGSLQLAIDAGVDFPTLLVRAACGEMAAAPGSYKVGIRSRWWWGDVDHLLARVRRSRSELSLPVDAPGRFRTFVDFLTSSGPRTHSEIFRISDPLPAFRETVDWLQRR